MLATDSVRTDSDEGETMTRAEKRLEALESGRRARDEFRAKFGLPQSCPEVDSISYEELKEQALFEKYGIGQGEIHD